MHIAELNVNGMITTTSTGSIAKPVPQTAFSGLLMLARGFGSHIHNQVKRNWQPLRGNQLPDDLRGKRCCWSAWARSASVWRHMRNFLAAR